jgi:hypothetical protein
LTDLARVIFSFSSASYYFLSSANERLNSITSIETYRFLNLKFLSFVHVFNLGEISGVSGFLRSSISLLFFVSNFWVIKAGLKDGVTFIEQPFWLVKFR